MKSAELVRARQAAERQFPMQTIDDYVTMVNLLSGFGIYQQTISGEPAEHAPTDLTGYAQAAYAGHGPVFSLMAIRMSVFSAIRFCWQRIRMGKPSGTFVTPALGLLERPWAGGTTQDVLMGQIVDADLTGNGYVTTIGDELVRLRPDWTEIILEPRRFRGGTVGYRKIGYLYWQDGIGNGDPVPFLPNEVSHFAPYPDPLASYRGMSWITPVVRQMINDKLMSKHQTKFFENGATPNMVVAMDAAVSFEQFKKFKEMMNLEHRGVENAYKTLTVGGGADVTIVGADFQQMAFTDVMGRGETRLAAAAGVPPVIAGFSEGLQGSSLNAGNYKQAWRRFTDGTMAHLWANMCGSLQEIFPAPDGGSRLWYDTSSVPSLREDAKDAADILAIKAKIIRDLGDGGWNPDAVVDAVAAENLELLKGSHSGMLSVQLQEPGAGTQSPTSQGGDQDDDDTSA